MHFINGIPLVVIELKNPQKEETTVSEAYHQLQNYKREIPSLFVYNAFLIISDGIITKAGTITSSEERFMSWRSKDGKEVYRLAKNTPDELEDKNTMNVFGDYIDVYDMTQSIEDKSTVKIFYENKVIKLSLKDAEQIDSEFEDITEDQEEYYIEKEKSRWSKIEALAGSEDRLKKMAKNIVEHFEERSSIIKGKAIIVVMSRRIKIIMNVVEYVLSWNEKKIKKFVKTVKELERLHSLCVTTDEAKEYNLEISFFKNVKTGILKIKQEEFYEKKRTSKTKLNAQLEGLISKSLITEDIIDIFDATGIEKPEISIFSEEFFEQIKNLKYKNIAVEILKRLLKGQITSIKRKNKIESKKFSDMLNNAIARYLNKAITNLELIDELMKMAKEIKKSSQKGKDLGLEDDEIAFYDALADNESAKKLIKDDILKKIAKELKSTIIKNLTVDWTLKNSTQAQMRVKIKSLLKKYKYLHFMVSVLLCLFVLDMVEVYIMF